MPRTCVEGKSRNAHQAAETGSGKTGAFGLPMVQIVYESLQALTKPLCHTLASLSQRSFPTAP